MTDATSFMQVVLPSEYPLILLGCVILCCECFLMGPIVIAPARFGTFTKEFMAQFKDEHEKAFPGTEPAAGGFPDCGDGRYSAKLPYKDWVTFNNAMRVHLNFVEMLPAIVTILCLSGLFLPKITMYVAFINAGARIIYTAMYIKGGSDSRVIGAVGGSLPLYLLAVASFITAIMEASK